MYSCIKEMDAATEFQLKMGLTQAKRTVTIVVVPVFEAELLGSGVQRAFRNCNKREQ